MPETSATPGKCCAIGAWRALLRPRTGALRLWEKAESRRCFEWPVRSRAQGGNVVDGLMRGGYGCDQFAIPDVIVPEYVHETYILIASRPFANASSGIHVD
jgi:hypothetical protein